MRRYGAVEPRTHMDRWMAVSVGTVSLPYSQICDFDKAWLKNQPHPVAQRTWGSPSVPVILRSVEIVVGSAECFPALHFVKMQYASPKAYCCPQSKVKVNVLTGSDKVAMCEVLEGGCLAEAGGIVGKKESSLCSTVLTSVKPELCGLPQ